IETHRAELAKAVLFLPHHRALLDDLRGRYRMAVVSNFDYTPTALAILSAAGIVEHFETIVVSDTVGWRKPAPLIFRQTLEGGGHRRAAGVSAGARTAIDAAAAHGRGMAPAWITPAADPVPAGLEPPTYELRDLADLRPILVTP